MKKTPLITMLLLFISGLLAQEIHYHGQAGPVTFGLPFKQGALKDASRLNLNGKPLQVRVNAKWPDGSVKWVLFDSDLPANFSGEFSKGQPIEGDLLYNNGTLDNGALKVLFPASGPLFTYKIGDEEGSADLLLKLQLDSPGPNDGENWLRNAGETKNFNEYTQNERSVTVEENGPLRATVRIAGEAGYRYIIRLTMYKNENTLKIQTTFIVTRNVNTDFLRSMILRINRPGQSTQSELLVGTPRVHHLVSWRDKSSPEGRGVLTDGDLTAVVKDFARLFPKELACDPKGIYFHIWPEKSGMLLDLRRREKVDPRYLDYANPDGGIGTAKTHDLYLSWGKNIAERVNHPVLPAASPQYYRDTLACGEFLVRGKEFPQLESFIEFGFRYLHQLRRAGHFDGMMDWGDLPLGSHGMADHMNQSHPEGAPFRGYTGWSNGDLALGHGFFLHFFRTGDQTVLRDGLDMAWHLADVDTIHYWPKKQQALGRRHDQQHWGTYPVDYGYASDEAVYAYLLTGENRFLEVLKKVAPSAYYGRYINVRLWEITGEKEYLERTQRALAKDKPFPKNDNFRGNSYDSTGYIFVDSILPGALNPKLPEAAARFYKRYSSPYLPKGFPPYAVAALIHKYDPSPENTLVLKVLLSQLKSYVAGKSFDLPPNATMDEFDKLNPVKNNTSEYSLKFFVALPYVLERLRVAGVSEQDCFDFLYDWSEPESFVLELESDKITASAYPQHKHFSYQLPLPIFPDWGMDRYLTADGKIQYQKAIKRLRLYEDGRLIGPVQFGHRHMVDNGIIGWSTLGNAIYLSTPDNSPPAQNGRKYVLKFTSAKDWQWEDKPSFDEKLATIYPYPNIKKAGDWWCAPLTHESPEPVLVYPEAPEIKARAEAALKRHVFTENDKPLVHWRRDQNLLIFKTSDGSDPRANGREYRLQYTQEKQ